jgi:aldose 1-epimerase
MPGLEAPDGRSRPLLRPSDAAAVAAGNPSNLACFPLVPFANRIGGSRFCFAGREYQLTPNRPPDPMAIHGFGFQAAWRVDAVNHQAARLTYEHHAPNSPFHFRAEQTFHLEPSCVRIELAVTHKGNDAMPYGIGLHPWLPRPADTQLQFFSKHVFIPDQMSLPRGPQAVRSEIDFAILRPLSEVGPLDACFAGWNGKAVVLWPGKDYAVEITAKEPFCAVHVFLPADRAILCVEPVSHVPNVHNHPEWAKFGALHTLKQGETLRGEMMIRPFLAFGMRIADCLNN